MTTRPIKTKPLKPKLFHAIIQIADNVPDVELLIRAKTEQGALTFAARKLIVCTLASQADLVRLTKAGVEAVDALDPEPDLIGPRSVNTEPVTA